MSLTPSQTPRKRVATARFVFIVISFVVEIVGLTRGGGLVARSASSALVYVSPVARMRPRTRCLNRRSRVIRSPPPCRSGPPAPHCSRQNRITRTRGVRPPSPRCGPGWSGVRKGSAMDLRHRKYRARARGASRFGRNEGNIGGAESIGREPDHPRGRERQRRDE